MRLIKKQLLLKLKYKNRGNTKLCKAIDELISIIEQKNWISKEQIKIDRPDADQIHQDGFYFFDIQIHRTMIMIEIGKDSEATVVWAGTHDEYESTFKNNKDVIKKWLSNKGWI